MNTTKIYWIAAIKRISLLISKVSFKFDKNKQGILGSKEIVNEYLKWFFRDACNKICKIQRKAPVTEFFFCKEAGWRSATLLEKGGAFPVS